MLIELAIAAAVLTADTVNHTPVVVSKSKAELCIEGLCKSVLVGKDTPTGEFILTRANTEAKGYGGEVLPFAETSDGVYAVHLLWGGRPHEQRERRIASNNVADRVITSGCINVDKETYQIVRSHNKLVITD